MNFPSWQDGYGSNWSNQFFDVKPIETTTTPASNVVPGLGGTITISGGMGGTQTVKVNPGAESKIADNAMWASYTMPIYTIGSYSIGNARALINTPANVEAPSADALRKLGFFETYSKPEPYSKTMCQKPECEIEEYKGK